MAKIAVLDQSTIDKIAAGEVVERPASVVKELLENAIDAKASAVTVEIRDGGTSLIRITDNGCGIEKEEIRLAFCRHATSKIQTAEDLTTVSSLGFRGEALSSIAAVSQVEFITKTPETLIGVRYRIEGGMEKEMEEVGAPEGTTFLVRNLFFNTPVRKKFLKSNTTEGAYVTEMVQKIALSHPEVSIRLIQNNQSKLHTSGNHSLKDIIYALYGREIAANLLKVEEKQNPSIQVTGFAGKPVIARGNRGLEMYFINGRYIKSKILYKAIEDAYKPYMMQHMYPFVVLQIQTDPILLDVNVHPTKMDVRFGNNDLVYDTVYRAVRNALEKKELIPQAELPDATLSQEKGNSKNISQQKTFDRGQPEKKGQDGHERSLCFEEHNKKERVQDTAKKQDVLKKENLPEKKAVKRENAFRMAEPFETHRKQQDNPIQNSVKEISLKEENMPYGEVSKIQVKEAVQQSLFEDKMLSHEARSQHRLIGQLFDTYWLVEYHNQLFIIDQHAAHEKVLYEKTMHSLKNREYTSQQISPPIILTLTPQEQVNLEGHRKELEQIGFEIAPFGDTEYAVSAIPDNLFSIAKKELLLEMIGNLSQDLILERVASMSCKAAVKGNHKMSFAEADQLIDELLELDNPYACPHGRPTIIAMSKYELEKKFKRIV